ncbi:hypothetical protein PMAYCL1PPCAC_14223, partial [Pristionchus mayeri]
SMRDYVVEDVEEKDTANNAIYFSKDSSETGQVKNIRRQSSRNVTRPLKYTGSMEESDEEDVPSVKERKSESMENMDKVPKKRRTSVKGQSQPKTMKKNNEEIGNETGKNELKCPECEVCSSPMMGWEYHLRHTHSTTPTLAGCFLRCDCGHESYSRRHSKRCEISNFTVIRKRSI